MSMIDSIKATYKELPKHPNEQSRELYISPHLDGEHPSYKYTFVYRIYGTQFGMTVHISEWELTQRRVPFNEQGFIDRMMISLKRELAESQYKITFPEDVIYTRINYYAGVINAYSEVVVNIPIQEWHKENPHAHMLQTTTVTEKEYDDYIRRYQR